ncbi:MAG TPA: hypothetical protein PJ991_10580 [Kiritimatiellia bacterium]|nr:hypothetical protein [Kiritimatiellia bacterium]
MNKIIAVLAIMAVSFPLYAATTPEEVALRYFEAFKKGDPVSVADSMHPDEIYKLKNQLLPLLKRVEQIDEQVVDLEIQALRQLMGASDASTLEEESARDFFIRFTRWVILRNPELNKAMADAVMKPVGHVVDGDIAYVVGKVDVTVMGTPISQMKVMTARKSDDGWLMTLTDEVEGVIRIMQRRFGRAGM